MSPIFRQMAKHPQIELQVAYCSLRGAEAAHDPEFNATVQWDVPVLDGYDWVEVPNRGSGSETFFGVSNPGLWGLIRKGQFDAVLCYVGYVRASFWIAYLASRFSRSAFLFGTDASTLTSRNASRWKLMAKRLFWPKLFSLADQVIVPSSATRDLMRSLKIPAERITLTPYSVDNDWWFAESRKVNREAVRAMWGGKPATFVILYCAKLQPWKRPMDLLQAFAKVNAAEGFLVFAGDGPLRSQLEKEAAALGIADRVRFLGFVNQSQLPAVYTSADVMVLPSEYEPFAVVVNEAMCCGCAVVVSDRVGAARDLVVPVCREFVYSFGDVDALAAVLKNALSDRALLQSIARAAAAHIQTWSQVQNISATVDAIRSALSRMRPRTSHFDKSAQMLPNKPSPQVKRRP